MTKIVLVTHGKFGEELLRSAEMIVGSQNDVYSVCLSCEESPECFGSKLDVALQDIGHEDTLILIDLFGGTPCNVAARWVRDPQIECVTGVNLPMLIETLMMRDSSTAAELAEVAAQAGKESVRNLGPLLNK
ncbi:MAG: PTS sugar transporter subunit IIA [Chloroflexota bacterium]|nr:PTS sugar transporter subunit IIA [Chloroflexota bacterium]